MLTGQLPMLLALLGTLLMALVIFAPSRADRPVATALAPSMAPPALERREPPPIESWETPVAAIAAVCAPEWPLLLDPRAAGCDAGARLGLIEALASVRAPWADAILRRALDEESDPRVHAAVACALAA